MKNKNLWSTWFSAAFMALALALLQSQTKVLWVWVASDINWSWVASDINWSKPYRVIKELIWVPSGEVISSGHQSLDLALKSSKIIVSDDLSCLIWFIPF